MSVVIENVSKMYGRQKALDQVSFEVKTGEIVGFIGPNGAGKSTLMKIITGFLPQDKGNILVNGLNINEKPLEVKRNIGYLPEHNPLYTNMYIQEYLEFVAGLYHLDQTKNKRIEEIIIMTGLTPERHKKIGALSKGFRQRVGLAQALIHNPSVLILDEPTTGLDPNQIVEIRNLISDIGKLKTVMLSTHIMQEVEAICHRIIIINKGQIVANEEKQNIYSQSKDSTITLLVEFNSEIDEGKIKQMEGVLRLANIKKYEWLIETISGRDLRQDIFNFAVKNNLIVLSMQRKEKSLEEVFHELTK